jgi:O-glycosyl hydrolase
MFLPIPSIFALVGILLSQQNSVHCATANVNLAGVRQTIQGFGASSAWQGRASDNAMNSLFVLLFFYYLRYFVV